MFASLSALFCSNDRIFQSAPTLKLSLFSQMLFFSCYISKCFEQVFCLHYNGYILVKHLIEIGRDGIKSELIFLSHLQNNSFYVWKFSHFNWNAMNWMFRFKNEQKLNLFHFSFKNCIHFKQTIVCHRPMYE